MNITLPADRTEAQVVDFVLARAEAGTTGEALVAATQAEFQATADDAELAVDRIYGGLVRARTRNPANRPDRSLDPLAWISFGRATADPSIIARLLPEQSARNNPEQHGPPDRTG
jgi:hypothetical protein